jgi:hypothetical protein
MIFNIFLNTFITLNTKSTNLYSVFFQYILDIRVFYIYLYA